MEPLDKILNGFSLFKKELFQEKNKQYIKELSQNQNPQTLIITCSDSRMDPAILLTANLGEIFVIRNVANIIPPFKKDHSSYHGTSAAIEYAVKLLEIKNIIILGHSNCGGIKALVEHTQHEKGFEYILDWVFILEKAKKMLPPHLTKEESYTYCEKMGIEISLQNLKTFPFIMEALQNKKLSLLGLYYSLSEGDLYYYSEATKDFKLFTTADDHKNPR